MTSSEVCSVSKQTEHAVRSEMFFVNAVSWCWMMAVTSTRHRESLVVFCRPWHHCYTQQLLKQQDCLTMWHKTKLSPRRLTRRPQSSLGRRQSSVTSDGRQNDEDDVRPRHRQDLANWCHVMALSPRHLQRVSTHDYDHTRSHSDLTRRLSTLNIAGNSWKYHIEYIYNKLLKFVGIFYKLRNKLPSVILQAIYFAVVHPHLLYGIELYAITGFTHLSKLKTLYNKSLRILQNKP